MHKIGIPLAPFKTSIARLLGPIIHTHTHGQWTWTWKLIDF